MMREQVEAALAAHKEKLAQAERVFLRLQGAVAALEALLAQEQVDGAELPPSRER